MKALPFSFASSVEACFIVLGRSYLTEAPFFAQQRCLSISIGVDLQDIGR